MKNFFVRFAQDEQGQDLVEYGLLLGVITVATIATVKLIGGHVAAIFTEAEAEIKTI